MQIKLESFLFVEAYFLHLQLRTMFDVSELIICSSERSRSPLLKIKYSFITAVSEDITQQNSKCRKSIEFFFEIVTRTLSDPSNNQAVVCAARKFLIGVCQVHMFVSSLSGFSPGAPDSLQHHQWARLGAHGNSW